METTDRLREIALKNKLTKADKTFVKEQCAALGIEITNTDCPDCYKDAAMRAWTELRKEDVVTTQRYKLREGVDVIVNGERCNNMTATDEAIERWLRMGLPREYVVGI